jgi:hypothetical protein
MNCESANDLVIDSLMDNLEPATAHELEQHLRSCSKCYDEAARMRQLWDDIAGVGVPEPRSDALVRFGRRLERRRSARGSRILQVAAAVILLLTGAAGGMIWGGLGTGGDEAAAASGQEFMLLIRGGSLNQDLPEARLVAEYGEWAGMVAEQGRLVSAEKLADDGGEWVSPDSSTLDERMRQPVEGFFLVKADGYQQAVALARGHPHVAYGGTIEVRQIDRP